MPVGLLVCVTGVSGSGKSTLINDTLYSAAARHLYGSTAEPAPHAAIHGLEHFDKVVNVDQSRVDRAHWQRRALQPGDAYTGGFSVTPIRELFAGVPTAKRERGLRSGLLVPTSKARPLRSVSGRWRDQGRNAFPARRLRAVRGVPRPALQPRNPRSPAQSAKTSRRNAGKVLTVGTGTAEFFGAVPVIARKLHTLLDVGLGYITLGQSCNDAVRAKRSSSA